MVEDAVTAVVVEVRKLDVGPNSMLAISLPEDWTADMYKRFSEYFHIVVDADDKLKGLRCILLPYGVELTVVEDVFAK